jgi:hypothetical protein
MFGAKKPRVVETPVLVVDALGFASRIAASSADQLTALGQRLEAQYHRFRAKVPFRAVAVLRRKVLGTGEFSTFQLNDMFVLYSERHATDLVFRHLISSVLLYHVLLIEGFVPRGGLGFGDTLKGNGCLIGRGFIDAYNSSEKRLQQHRNVCAIQVSPEFLAHMPSSERAYRLLCFYEGAFFVHPFALVDADEGRFDADRVLGCLKAAGVNAEKLEATERFLRNFEDYDRALQLDSKTWEAIRRAHGA